MSEPIVEEPSPVLVVARPHAIDNENARLLLLAQHSTLADMQQLRIISPLADTVVRLKFYGDSTDEDAWFAEYVVAGATSEHTMAEAVLSSINANAGSYVDTDDVRVDNVRATFVRLLGYFQRTEGALLGEGQLQAHADLYTLLHFMRNNCVPQVKEILEAAKYAEPKPFWFALLFIRLPDATTPFALLNNFFDKHEQTIKIRLPRDNFAVRLAHFAAVCEAYGVIGTLLSFNYICDALPLSMGAQLATHLATRVDFTLALQEKEPSSVATFVPAERAEDFKRQLGNYSVASLWPALSFLSEWTTSSARSKKHDVLRANLDALESRDEQARAASYIVDHDAQCRLEQLKLLASQIAKDLSAATEFRERCRNNLYGAVKRLEMLMAMLTQRVERGDTSAVQQRTEADALLANLRRCLEMDDEWVQDVYSVPPPALPNDEMGREGIVVTSDIDQVAGLHHYIQTTRSRLAYLTRELEMAFQERRELEELDEQSKLATLREQLSQASAADYFGDQ